MKEDNGAGGPKLLTRVFTVRKKLTVFDMAKALGKHPETIRRWCRKGLLPSHRIEREYYSDPKEFDDWFMKQ